MSRAPQQEARNKVHEEILRLTRALSAFKPSTLPRRGEAALPDFRQLWAQICQLRERLEKNEPALVAECRDPSDPRFSRRMLEVLFELPSLRCTAKGYRPRESLEGEPWVWPEAPSFEAQLEELCERAQQILNALALTRGRGRRRAS